MTRVVVDIPNNEFQACVRRDANMTGGIADSYIAQGIVLPEGHGDLIDRSELIKVLETEIMYTEDTKRRATLNYVFCVLVGSVPTVIEGEEE